MEYFDYRDWIEWPESDIQDYAREIAADHSLTAIQADHLEGQMTQQAGHWPKRRERIGPSKMDTDMESNFRSMDNGDDEVFQQNRRVNTPYRPPKFDLEEQWETIGSGLTRRRSRQIIRESPALKKMRQRAERQRANHPFTAMNQRIRNQANEAMWAANCYPIGYGD